MTIITLATVVDAATHEYQANGKIVRAFDTNGQGDLLPVEHKQHLNNGRFTLPYSPFGKVYAEVVR